MDHLTALTADLFLLHWRTSLSTVTAVNFRVKA
jgi:hypothetical protein